jgi:acetyl-CoA carboxylase carboxyltransferase component
VSVALAAATGGCVDAGLRRLDDRPVGWFRLQGGKRRGALGPVEGRTIARLVDMAVDAGQPVVGVLDTSGADVSEGISSLHAWGGVAAALARASGVVPIVLAVVGPCVSGPALLLGLADVVVMTADAFAYVSGPDVVLSMTGRHHSPESLGGAAVHGLRSGVATMVVADEDEALAACCEILTYLPSNNISVAPELASGDPVDRRCTAAAAAVPRSPSASYDMGDVVGDVVDRDSLLELRAGWAPSLMTALGRVDGRPVGIVASQPARMAGTLDIEASQKGARFVQWCDAFGLPLLTFVDTPGFLPGRDIEWRGMIRHGAELVHAYGAATVPRICVIVRKAYGGAYIVMDSKSLGSDLCVAWPSAEVAVMGAAGAVRVLHRRRLDAIDEPGERLAREVELVADYEARFCTPAIAAERGIIDDVIAPEDTRRIIAEALPLLADKREHLPRRRHANGPL